MSCNFLTCQTNINMCKRLLYYILLYFTTVNGKTDDTCSENGISDSHFECEQGQLSWDKFDWLTYISKDVTEADQINPEQRFGIHLLRSVEIGVNRTVPENRAPECRDVPWSDRPLPKTSVIITYRDEPRSTLLRTVVSVFEQSPADLIEEIILVDDNNDDVTVGEELKVIEKLVVLRNDQREGLIRSRIKGTLAAKGEALVFLDSHCEVEVGWLEPLLERLVSNPKMLAAPVIDNINLENFSFEPVSTFLRGGFNWRLDFFWEWLPARDRARLTADPTRSFASPAIAGGLFAINRKWFIELGIYDRGMEIWGGENIELSLRIWSCGGRIETVPCSKVGHIYKKRNVYSYPKGSRDTRECNTRRVADVWLDEFKVLHQVNRKKSLDCGDITDRIELKKNLKCKNFKWFIENVYPELQVPRDGDLAFGSIGFNLHSMPKCLDGVALGRESVIGGNSCLQTYFPQRFRLTPEGKIAQDDFCFSLAQPQTGALIISELCNYNSDLMLFKRVKPKNKLQGYQIRHKSLDLCLDVGRISDQGLMVMRCDQRSKEQRFLFDYDSMYL